MCLIISLYRQNFVTPVKQNYNDSLLGAEIFYHSA